MDKNFQSCSMRRTDDPGEDGADIRLNIAPFVRFVRRSVTEKVFYDTSRSLAIQRWMSTKD